MGYIVASGGNSTGRFYLTDTCNKPRIAVKVGNSTSYLPMKTTTTETTANHIRTVTDTWVIANCESNYKSKASSTTKSKTFSFTQQDYIMYTSMFMSDMYKFTRSIVSADANTIYYYSSESTFGNVTSNKYYRTITSYTSNHIIRISINSYFNTNYLQIPRVAPGQWCQTNETAVASYTSKTYNSLYYSLHGAFNVTFEKYFNLTTNLTKNTNVFGNDLYVYNWCRISSSWSVTATANITREVDGYAETNKSYTIHTEYVTNTFTSSARLTATTWM